MDYVLAEKPLTTENGFSKTTCGMHMWKPNKAICDLHIKQHFDWATLSVRKQSLNWQENSVIEYYAPFLLKLKIIAIVCLNIYIHVGIHDFIEIIFPVCRFNF